MTRLCRILLPLTLSLCWTVSAAAQERAAADAPLEQFVQHVARLWSAGDVGALVELIPAENRVVLDTGSGIETANSRHAAAALRALFADRENVSARAIRVTIASTRPPRGFGELAWTFRARGAPSAQSQSVYLGAVWETGEWRISELRLILNDR